MDYHSLKIALEVLTEGGDARIPARFRRVADRGCEQNRAWVTDPHIQGFGIARQRTGGRRLRDLALKVYVERKLPPADVAHPAPKDVRLSEILDVPVPIDVEAIGTMRLDYDPIR